jgi:hypothetical protein
MSTKNSWIASIACAFGLAASAQAVDLFKQTELPDQGFGSDAYWTRTAGGIVTVYGSVRVSQGRRNAFLWDLDNDGVMSSGPFPSMVGMEAESVGGAVFANGMEVAIGRMYPAGDPASSRAVLWRKPPGGAWSLPTSLFGSMRSDLGWGYATSDALKWAGWIEIDSVMRPVVFEVTDTLGATTHFLQSPPGGGAALRLNGPGAERVVGWATFPSGYMRASAWDLNSDGLYGIRAGGFGDAVSSLFLDVTNASGAGAALGTALRGQRSLAFLQSIPPNPAEPLGERQLLGPLPGLQNSGATSLPYNEGDTGTHEAGYATGTSFNSGGATVATVWTDMRPLSARMLLADQANAPDLLDWMWDCAVSGTGIVKYGPVGAAMTAMAFPSGTLGPDTMSEVYGRFRNGTFPECLWHEDGEEAEMRLEQVGDARIGEFIVTLRSLALGSAMTGGTVRLRLRLMTNRPNASGALRVCVFDHSAGGFVTVYQSTVTGTAATHGIPIPPSPNWQDPLTGELRVRVRSVVDTTPPTARGMGVDELAWDR